MTQAGGAKMVQTKNKLYEIGIAAFLHDIGKPFARDPKLLGFIPPNNLEALENTWKQAIETFNNKISSPLKHKAKFITDKITYNKHVFWGMILITALTNEPYATENTIINNPFEVNKNETIFWKQLNINPYMIKGSILLHHFGDKQTAKLFLEALNLTAETINNYLEIWSTVELIKQADHNSAAMDRRDRENKNALDLPKDYSLTIHNMLKIIGRPLQEIKELYTQHKLKQFPLTTLDASHISSEKQQVPSQLEPAENRIENTILKALNKHNLTKLIAGSPSDKIQSISNFYEQLQQLFKHFAKNNITSAEQFFSNLNILVKRYLYFTPADITEPIPVISLYEHLYSTALLAGLLYELKVNSSSTVGILTFDFSGIQKYIYNIKAKKYALKTIKARSFLVQIQLKSIKHYVLDTLNLPTFFEISDVAGKVILAIPNFETKQNTINSIIEKINNKLFKKYKANLSINVGIETIKGPNAQNELKNFYTDLIKAIRTSISNVKKSKRTPLVNVLFKEQEMPNPKKDKDLESNLDAKDNEYELSILSKDKFVLPYKIKANAKLCELCQKDIASRTIPNSKIQVCENCYEQVEIGGHLSRAVGILWYNNYLENSTDSTSKLNTTSSYKLLFHNIKFIEEYNSISPQKDAVQRNKANGLLILDFGLAKSSKSKQTTQTIYDYLQTSNWTEYTPIANYSARVKGQNKNKNKIKSFNGLSRIIKDHTFLAILKGDVDNLGHLFGTKLKELYELLVGKNDNQTYSLSYVRTLSFTVKLFFEIFLNTLVQELDTYNNTTGNNRHLSILYSGGDDFLIVGRWDKIVELTSLLDYFWKEYTNSNINTTFSASIYLFKPGTPFLTSVENADNILTKAKSYDESKNKLALQEYIFKAKTPLLTVLKNSKFADKDFADKYAQLYNNLNMKDSLNTEFLEKLSNALEEQNTNRTIYRAFEIINKIATLNTQKTETSKSKLTLAQLRAYLYYMAQRSSEKTQELLTYLFNHIKTNDKLTLNNYIATLVITLYLIRYNLLKE